MVDADIHQAYAACVRDARRHYENFPVASWFVPRHARPHVAAVYAFARAADDFADEGERTADERRQLRELIEADESVTSKLSADQIAACFDIDQLLRNVATIIDRLQGEAAHVAG